MPVPPPPPAPPPPGPPAPPPPPLASQGRSAPPKLKQETGGGGRTALLSDIHKGARLRKVEVNDRSAPVIDGAKKNGGTGNGRSAIAPPAGGLFAAGFPVLKPSGQREATAGNKNAPQLPGMKGSVPKQLDQMPIKIDLSKPVPHTIAARPPPPRPTILGQSAPVPPPIPPSSSKPHLMPSSPVPPTFKERSAKPTVESSVPPSPLNSQDKTKLQRPLSNFFPSTPPPLPPHPPPPLPPGYPGRRSPSPSLADARDHSGPPDPRLEDHIPPLPEIRDLPPPPPPPLHPMSMSAKRRLSEPLPPPPFFVSEHSNVPPRPPKGPPGRPSVPPVPGHGRPPKLAANSGGRLAPPPPPPARSPSTELSSRQQGHQPPNRNLAQQGYRPPSPGNIHHLDDFESKFTFHSLEDLPPPEVYEPFERVYPSKCHTAPPGPPPQRPQIR
ncbi:WAS/WASL-interacting protein family member 3 [Hyla sarda]|uniref:WAS/WASL-interacting protein family member 3 n=1 Tax=Hyla sarda TaxID=327740 RepID=UPI0024C3DA5F|nr:WAS/WASL-interacting protein family member 3 [Hyla sarda]XP_056375872.1 WAS/WASL-interacting protein family member 3 [Hyla sarda]XP_056375873.1 WAS/WASL-interacting protein family member 3 [Hyla sarda]XP_056375874.1 WAS/WASL-interacting protein family member 3 [Hyla sarda]XP_056375875.1 WAS/WASL-interacting protein family member 3 [Hyla sarda]XP_056375876.1 WAS/WASL-interacting protein family member 3 [Hyla sarda]XP_056375877.1 WAS/WASL-interacting protein family member 3 [Hyla sarda]XP_0